ncbi:MAG: PHP domain-containing protein [Chitinivibrionales bacterium]|nr:PHP domain-containing protein [Chitinivibrionales bacterium]
MLLDLHTHSTCSDGTMSPMQLVDHAKKCGLHLCALCDHDTIEGCEVFATYGASQGIQAIAGIELSAEWETGCCHILGLGLSTDNEALEKILVKIRQGRLDRNVVILEKLKKIGFAIEAEELQLEAGGTVVSRVHIGQIMVRKGYVATVQEAFTRYLSKGGPAYADRFRLPPVEVVKGLHAASAFVVIAHPTQLRCNFREFEDLLEQLIPYGLDGIEVFSPYTVDSEINFYLSFAQKYSLFVTGGSDFHGANKPDHRLGYYKPSEPIPSLCAEGIYHLNSCEKV